ncbi:MAG: hypothetical protein FWC79_03340 [Oscillospiraceae bacterium]|nr:hypothetical protein [Oscillospiraceae bacterium]
MKKCLLLGNNGREAAMAEFISKGYSLYAVLPHENPSIVDSIQKSGGKYIVGDPFDKEIVRNFIRENDLEVCVISSDNLQQDGLNDLAMEEGLTTFGATSEGAKIEWKKTYALDIVEQLAPEMIIKNYNVTDEETLKRIVDTYSEAEFVVKPEGLTGGKGVKVGGVHFASKEEGYEYAIGLLKAAGNVIIQDKVQGEEFTVMALTDGKNLVITPTTFDYPYRLDGDKGPGTGGMGTISFANGLLPFLTESDIDECTDLMKKTVEYVNRDSLEFKGVIYGGFFKCADGIKFIEFNARFGDPESINVLNLLENPFTEVIEHISEGTLTEENCKFKKECTFVVYVVSPDYAMRENNEPCVFTLNTEAILDKGAKIYFAGTKRVEGNTYVSVSNSRLFAVMTSADTLEEAKAKAYSAMEGNIDPKLHYRKDIGEIYKH